MYFIFLNETLTVLPRIRFLERFVEIASREKFELSVDEVREKIIEFEKGGFKMFRAWTRGFFSPERVLCPSKNVYTFGQLISTAKNTLSLTHGAQQEFLGAIEYWKLVDSEQYQANYGSYPSFIDGREERLRKKLFKLRKV